MLVHSWYGPDIWYHLTWGRDLLSNGRFLPSPRTLIPQPIPANVYWLFQISLYGLYAAGGLIAVSLLFGLLWVAVARRWLELTGAGARRFGPLFFLFFVCCVQLRFEQRPEVFSYFFLSTLLVVLIRRDPARPMDAKFALTLAAITVAWSNCHGYFALAPAIGGLWWIARPRRQTFAVFLLITVATFVSPFTWHNWQLVFSLMRLSHGLRFINQELMPPPFWPMPWPMPLFWALWLMTSLWGLRALGGRRDLFAALLAILGASLAVQASRNGPLYLLLSAPALGGVLSDLERVCARAPRLVTRVLLYAPSLIAVGLAVTVVTDEYFEETGSLASFGFHLERASYPIDATEFLSARSFKGRLFCDSYDGGYLEYHLPDVHVAGDSYFTDATQTLRYFAAIREPAQLRALDEQMHFDALLINIENIDEVLALQNDIAWNLVYIDSHRLLYLRRGDDPAPLDLAHMSFYHGENLRHWAYAFGVDSWAGLALRLNDRQLARKLLADLDPAPTVPSTVVRYLAELGLRSGDTELTRMVQRLSAKMYVRDADDLEKLHAIGFN